MEILNKIISADVIFDGEKCYTEHQILLDADNRVIDIQPLQKTNGVVHYTGIITPGFVNCHCHTELSFLYEKIPQRTGLIGFVQQIMQQRYIADEATIKHAIAVAMSSMYDQGIVALGDICNTSFSIESKKNIPVACRNFIEIAGFLPAVAKERMHNALQLKAAFDSEGLWASIVPHAPYSVSKQLFEMINAVSENAILSIHNQECEAENHLFLEKKGGFLSFYDRMCMPTDTFEPTGKNSLPSYLPNLMQAKQILLVHNTFVTEQDIVIAEAMAKDHQLALYWVLCPKANLYIEGKLPPIDLFLKHGCRMVVGTDSLASNDKLNILDELQTLQEHFPFLKIDTLLTWATANGAAALGFDHLGRIKKGSCAAINLISSNFTFLKKIV